MLNTTYLSQTLNNWLLIVKRHFAEFACLICASGPDQAIDIDLTRFYNDCITNNTYKNIAERRALHYAVSYNMFLKIWPLYNYVFHLSRICSRTSVVNTVIENANPSQTNSLEQSLLQIIPEISKQEVIFKIFRDKQQISTVMFEIINQAQAQIFDCLLQFYQTCAELYFNADSPQILPLLRSIDNAPTMLEFMFGDNSKFFNNSIEKITENRKYENIYFWARIASLFASFAAACFIWLGNTKYRDIYILLLVAAVGVFISTFIHKSYLASLVITTDEEARLYVQHTIPGHAFNPVIVQPQPKFRSEYPLDVLSPEVLALELGY